MDSASDIAAALLRITDDGTFADGCAEPWVADVLAALLVANASRTVIEIGGFQGRTSRRLLNALKPLPWPKSFTVCELEPHRAAAVRAALALDGVCAYANVVCASSLDWIPTLPDESVDFVWLDGNHEKPHVYRELEALLPKMAPGGMICGHDVFGVCDLVQVFGAVAHERYHWICLDLPRLGPAGGIGIIQIPR